jgi:hypothetical protein
MFFTGLMKAKSQVTSAPDLDLPTGTTELKIRILLYSLDAKKSSSFHNFLLTVQ